MPNKRTIIIGDVHGMLQELKLLLNLEALSRDDQLVFCGDLVDKGPDSVDTVKFVRQLREEGFNVVLVLGNHEEKHARFRKVLAEKGPAAAAKFKGFEELKAITDGLSEADIAFLDSAVLFHRIPEHDALVVHAGILPLTTDLDNLSKKDEQAILRLRHVKGVSTHKVTIEFTVDGEGDLTLEEVVQRARSTVPVRVSSVEKGSFVSLGEETADDPFWAEVYDGRFGHVYFGHNPFIGKELPVEFPHATGLDLGCVFGGRLAAAILERGKKARYVGLKTSRKFAESLWEDR